jgi:hypothetical protein
MHLKAKQCCWMCSNRLGLYFFQPITKHGDEYGWYACPTHYRDAYKRQALEDMGHGPEYEAYCRAIANPGQGPKGKQEEMSW